MSVEGNGLNRLGGDCHAFQNYSRTVEFEQLYGIIMKHHNDRIS